MAYRNFSQYFVVYVGVKSSLVLPPQTSSYSSTDCAYFQISVFFILLHIRFQYFHILLTLLLLISQQSHMSVLYRYFVAYLLLVLPGFRSSCDSSPVTMTSFRRRPRWCWFHSYCLLTDHSSVFWIPKVTHQMEDQPMIRKINCNN